MTFEEDFPTIERIFRRNKLYTGLMVNSVIEKNYIDKAKVREAIDKIEKRFDNQGYPDVNSGIDDLKKELGL